MISWIDVILLTLNLCVAVFNCFAFLLPLRINSPNVVLFYAVSFVLLISRIIEVGHMALKPATLQWEYNTMNRDVTIWQVASVTATCSFLVLGLLMFVTMFQIG